MQTTKKKIVVIGGGTGTYTLLRGLTVYADTVAITAIVTMADSGGSTGRLRDEFGQLPVGDVRMALCALATEIDTPTELLRELFLYRFDKGTGLSGHNFGNLLLTALTDILGDTSMAIEAAGQILRVKGSVIPVTTDDVQLVATYDTGEVVVGEHHIDNPGPEAHQSHIVSLRVTPEATINPKAQAAILAADLIVLGPGDLYTSILANCVVGGVEAAIKQTPAKIMYISNIMSRAGQTTGMHLVEYVSEIKQYSGKTPDIILHNTKAVPPELLQKYLAEGNHPVCNNCEPQSYNVYEGDFIAREPVVVVSGDAVPRSLVRHDSVKLSAAIIEYLKNY